MAGGIVEERLRRLANRVLRARRGQQARFAEALGRQAPWVSMYLDGKVDADLDTSVQMLKFLRVTPNQLVRELVPSPPADPIPDWLQGLGEDDVRAVRDFADYIRAQRAKQTRSARRK